MKYLATAFLLFSLSFSALTEEKDEVPNPGQPAPAQFVHHCGGHGAHGGPMMWMNTLTDEERAAISNRNGACGCPFEDSAKDGATPPSFCGCPAANP